MYLFYDSADVWQSHFVFSSWPMFSANNTIQFFVRSGLNLRVRGHESEEPLEYAGHLYSHQYCFFIKRKVAHRLNAPGSERVSNEAHVGPIKLLRLLAFQQCLDKTVRNILAGLHTTLYSEDHGSVYFHEVFPQFICTI